MRPYLALFASFGVAAARESKVYHTTPCSTSLPSTSFYSASSHSTPCSSASSNYSASHHSASSSSHYYPGSSYLKSSSTKSSYPTSLTHHRTYHDFPFYHASKNSSSYHKTSHKTYSKATSPCSTLPSSSQPKPSSSHLTYPKNNFGYSTRTKLYPPWVHIKPTSSCTSHTSPGPSYSTSKHFDHVHPAASYPASYAAHETMSTHPVAHARTNQTVTSHTTSTKTWMICKNCPPPNIPIIHTENTAAPVPAIRHGVTYTITTTKRATVTRTTTYPVQAPATHPVQPSNTTYTIKPSRPYPTTTKAVYTGGAAHANIAGLGCFIVASIAAIAVM